MGHYAVTVPADAGAHEQLLNIAQSAGGAVQKIFATSIAEHATGHGDFGKTQIHPGGLEVFLVHIAKGDRDLGHARGLAAAGAVGAAENDIGHFAATQGFCGLFAQHPSNGVGDIRFTTSIGAHHGGDARLEIQGCLVRK